MLPSANILFVVAVFVLQGLVVLLAPGEQLPPLVIIFMLLLNFVEVYVEIVMAASGVGGDVGGDVVALDTPFHVDRWMEPLAAFFATMLPSAGARRTHAD